MQLKNKNLVEGFTAINYTLLQFTDSHDSWCKCFKELHKIIIVGVTINKTDGHDNGPLQLE